MFAGGLSMFGSGGEDDEDEEESANAGIELALLGSQLRPFVFFQGQSELMNHIFSGTASSRTTALQVCHIKLSLDNVKNIFRKLNISYTWYSSNRFSEDHPDNNILSRRNLSLIYLYC